MAVSYFDNEIISIRLKGVLAIDASRLAIHDNSAELKQNQAQQIHDKHCGDTLNQSGSRVGFIRLLYAHMTKLANDPEEAVICM